MSAGAGAGRGRGSNGGKHTRRKSAGAASIQSSYYQHPHQPLKSQLEYHPQQQQQQQQQRPKSQGNPYGYASLAHRRVASRLNARDHTQPHARMRGLQSASSHHAYMQDSGSGTHMGNIKTSSKFRSSTDHQKPQQQQRRRHHSIKLSTNEEFQHAPHPPLSSQARDRYLYKHKFYSAKRVQSHHSRRHQQSHSSAGRETSAHADTGREGTGEKTARAKSATFISSLSTSSSSSSNASSSSSSSSLPRGQLTMTVASSAFSSSSAPRKRTRLILFDDCNSGSYRSGSSGHSLDSYQGRGVDCSRQRGGSGRVSGHDKAKDEHAIHRRHQQLKDQARPHSQPSSSLYIKTPLSNRQSPQQQQHPHLQQHRHHGRHTHLDGRGRLAIESESDSDPDSESTSGSNSDSSTSSSGHDFASYQPFDGASRVYSQSQSRSQSGAYSHAQDQETESPESSDLDEEFEDYGLPHHHSHDHMLVPNGDDGSGVHGGGIDALNDSNNSKEQASGRSVLHRENSYDDSVQGSADGDAVVDDDVDGFVEDDVSAESDNTAITDNHFHACDDINADVQHGRHHKEKHVNLSTDGGGDGFVSGGNISQYFTFMESRSNPSTAVN